MAHSDYRGYTIITQVTTTDDGVQRWRYKIFKRQPLTDYPSEFAYSTSQEAEAAARRHIDSITIGIPHYPK